MKNHKLGVFLGSVALGGLFTTFAAAQQIENAVKPADADVAKAVEQGVGEIAKKQPNVLLICVDDLRTDLNCYGQSYVKSPNIDRLARTGRMFNNHYVHQAACGPSRCTLLSGKRTDSWNYFRRPLPREAASLPELFRRAGYSTVSIGKVNHSPGGGVPRGFQKAFAPTGQWKKKPNNYAAFFGYAHGQSHHKMVWPNDKADYLPWECADVDDEGYPDGLNAKAAVNQLNALSKSDKPFFLAVGFYKPHSPYNSPKKYWDLYDKDKLPQAKWKKKPDGVEPAWTIHHGTQRSYEPTTHYKWKWGDFTVPEEQGKILRHAYTACISYTDAQIGKVLDELEKLELDDDTIVVLWSDHGYHLGEHGVYGKFTLHEVSVRSPLVVRVPGQKNPGVNTSSIVETVDILPSICDLAGIKYGPHFEGSSFADVVADPEKEARDSALSDLPVSSISGMGGWSIKTATHRYTRWSDKDGNVTLEELYDHVNDPDETRNIATTAKDALAAHQAIMDRRLGELDLAKVRRK